MQTHSTKEARELKNAEHSTSTKHLCSEYLNPGDTVYAILRHVSKNGMCRFIDLVVVKENRPLRITWDAAKTLYMTYDHKHEAIPVKGCGFCPAHFLVADLAWWLFGNYEALNYKWL
jgi:hypothetical protein